MDSKKRLQLMMIGVLVGFLLAGCGGAVEPTAVPPLPTPVPTLVPPTALPVAPTPTPTPIPLATTLPVPTLSSQAGSYEEWVALFDYPASPPEVEEIGTEQRGDVTIHDIAFPSPYGKKIAAYLVTPAGSGPHPAILYVHWYETGAQDSNRTEFLDEAVELANQGVVSLLVNDIFALPGPRRLWTKKNATADREIVIQQVVELRQALDLLVSRADVDPERIAYVGHDFGGMFGSVLVGVDRRVKACVIMAAVPKFGDWFLLGSSLDKKGQDAYRAQLSPVDPEQYIGHAAPAALLFQFARRDEYVAESQATAFFGQASEPKQMNWYDGGHALQESVLATQDRLDWLRTALGVEGAAP